MKKTGLIFAIFFVITLAIPALVCFVLFNGDTSQSSEITSIFREGATQAVCYHLFW